MFLDPVAVEETTNTSVARRACFLPIFGTRSVGVNRRRKVALTATIGVFLAFLLSWPLRFPTEACSLPGRLQPPPPPQRRIKYVLSTPPPRIVSLPPH